LGKKQKLARLNSFRIPPSLRVIPRLAPHTLRVSSVVAQQFAEERGFPFFEVSSKHNVNVTEFIEHLAKLAKDRLEGTVTTTSVNDNHVEVDTEEKPPQATTKDGCNIL